MRNTVLILCLATAFSGCDVIAPCGRTRMLQTTADVTLTPLTDFGQNPDSVPPSGISLGLGPLYDTNLEERPRVFDELWDPLIDARTLPGGDGVAITMQGVSGSDPQSIARLVLILPTPLRRGVTYPITRVLAVPIGSNNPDVYGTKYLGSKALATAGEAEIGFFYGQRRFVDQNPLAEEFPAFVATTGNGTVTVTNDAGRDLDFDIEVTLADANGRTLRMNGSASTMGNITTNSCTN